MVGSKQSEWKHGVRLRQDGRKSLLVYLDAELIKELKKVALDDGRNAYEIVEEAAREWLARRDKKQRSP